MIHDAVRIMRKVCCCGDAGADPGGDDRGSTAGVDRGGNVGSGGSGTGGADRGQQATDRGNAAHSTAGPLGGMGTPGGAAEAAANAMGMSPGAVVAQGVKASDAVNSGKMSAAESIGMDANAISAIEGVNAVNAANKARGMTMTSIGLVPTSSFSNSTKSNMSPGSMGSMFGSLTRGQNPGMTSDQAFDAVKNANLGFTDNVAANIGLQSGGLPGILGLALGKVGMPMKGMMTANAILSAATGSNPIGVGTPESEIDGPDDIENKTEMFLTNLILNQARPEEQERPGLTKRLGLPEIPKLRSSRKIV